MDSKDKDCLSIADYLKTLQSAKKKEDEEHVKKEKERFIKLLQKLLPTFCYCYSKQLSNSEVVSFYRESNWFEGVLVNIYLDSRFLFVGFCKGRMYLAKVSSSFQLTDTPLIPTTFFLMDKGSFDAETPFAYALQLLEKYY